MPHDLPFEANYILVMVDMTIASIKNIFEELKVFKGIFGFLLSSKNMKSLDDIELRKCCTTFAEIFSQNDSPDVELDDLLSELRVLQMT